MPWYTFTITAHDCEMEAEIGKLARSSRAKKLGVCSAAATRNKTKLREKKERTDF